MRPTLNVLTVKGVAERNGSAKWAAYLHETVDVANHATMASAVGQFVVKQQKTVKVAWYALKTFAEGPNQADIVSLQKDANKASLATGTLVPNDAQGTATVHVRTSAATSEGCV